MSAYLLYLGQPFKNRISNQGGVHKLGGGSSGYTGPSGKSDKDREDAFDSAEDEVRDSRVRNVFISFHTKDENAVKLLRHQAKDNQYGLRFNDYSVKEPFDNAWKTQTKKRIEKSSAFIVMIGEDTWTRTAVIWEAKQAYEMGKKVIGVRISKNREDYVPRILRENNSPVVDWKLARISKELE